MMASSNNHQSPHCSIMGSEKNVSHSWLFWVMPMSFKMKSSMGEIRGFGQVRISVGYKEARRPSLTRGVKYMYVQG